MDHSFDSTHTHTQNTVRHSASHIVYRQFMSEIVSLLPIWAYWNWYITITRFNNCNLLTSRVYFHFNNALLPAMAMAMPTVTAATVLHSFGQGINGNAKMVVHQIDRSSSPARLSGSLYRGHPPTFSSSLCKRFVFVSRLCTKFVCLSSNPKMMDRLISRRNANCVTATAIVTYTSSPIDN